MLYMINAFEKKILIIAFSFFVIFFLFFVKIVAFSKDRSGQECGKFLNLQTKLSNQIFNKYELALPATLLCTGASPGWHYPFDDLPILKIMFNKQKVKAIFIESQRDEIDRLPKDILVDFYSDNKFVKSANISTNCVTSENIFFGQPVVTNKIILTVQSKCKGTSVKPEVLTVIRNLIFN